MKSLKMNLRRVMNVCLIFTSFIFYLFERCREVPSLVCSSHPQELDLCQTKARGQELHLDLSYEWQGHKYLSQHLLSLSICLSRKLESREARIQTRRSIRRCEHPGSNVVLGSTVPVLYDKRLHGASNSFSYKLLTFYQIH